MMAGIRNNRLLPSPLFPLAILVMMVGAACGDTASEGGPGDGHEVLPTLIWSDCPKFFQSECATVYVPLDWNDPEGTQVSLLVSRLSSGYENAPQLWLLMGGPGVSGGYLYDTVGDLHRLAPNLDIFVIEHRGIGGSNRIGCPSYEQYGWVSNWPACLDQVAAEWGDAIDHFTTTNAANDVGYVIKLATQGTQSAVFVYGASYGAYWALRYLQLFPDQASGVILDSIFSPGTQSFWTYDRDGNTVGKKLADLCAQDAACTSKMGSDPWTRLGQVFDLVADGHCSEVGFDRLTLRMFMATLLEWWEYRVISLALAYRLDRCNANDVTAINHLLTAFGWKQSSARPDISPFIQNHIMLSEMVSDPPPSAQEVLDWSNTAFFSTELAVELRGLWPTWPRYGHDGWVDQWPTTSVPILMTNGDLDPKTPIETALAAAEHLNGPRQTFVTIPNADHETWYSSPVQSSETHCGMQIALSFISDPSSAPDTACLDDLRPLVFGVPTATSNLLLGTPDMWE